MLRNRDSCPRWHAVPSIPVPVFHRASRGWTELSSGKRRQECRHRFLSDNDSRRIETSKSRTNSEFIPEIERGLDQRNLRDKNYFKVVNYVADGSGFRAFVDSNEPGVKSGEYPPPENAGKEYAPDRYQPNTEPA